MRELRSAAPSSAREKRRNNPVQGKKTSKNQRVREQAYLIWLDEGRPEGRDKEHWERAEQIIDRMDEISKEDESGNMTAVGPVPGP